MSLFLMLDLLLNLLVAGGAVWLIGIEAVKTVKRVVRVLTPDRA